MQHEKARKIGRRDFLKKSVQSAVYLSAISVFPLIESCASDPQYKEEELKKEGPVQQVHYPRLPGHKIQSPEHYGIDGCMTAIWWGQTPAKVAINRYEQKVEKPPSILFVTHDDSRIPHRGLIFARSPDSDYFYWTVWDDLAGAAENGVIPLITYGARYKVSDKQQATLGNVRDQVIKGIHNQAITEVAQILKRFGDQYGGFFIRTMQEMNLGHVWPWAGSPDKFKKAWIHIWDIFDGEGANEYATWLWNPYVASPKRRIFADDYYPGDKFVDWIGMNGYAFENESFSSMFGQATEDMNRDHPTKPLMVAEVGFDENSLKPNRVLRTFEDIKSKYPEIKALNWWHEKWRSHGVGMNSKIDSSLDALEAFKQGISDPYFLDKIPYRG